MIISRIVGGLGNQMFCYAAGKALASHLNVSLQLDTYSYHQYKLHQYALNYFDIGTKIANQKEYAVINPHSYFKKILAYLSPSKQKLSLYQEKNLTYDDQVSKLPDQTYLSGYWQSEKYFLNIEKDLRRDFKFKTDANQINTDFITRIQSCNAISVHIRRGDYISNANANAVHGTCDLNYYQSAAALLQSKLDQKNLTYFVFSDDPEWVQHHLKLDGHMIFVSHNNGSQNHEDLRLMSACQHHIIANSTFSWWGAWLNSSKEKIVIAPKQWFKDKSYNCRDLIPESWIRI